MIADNIRVLDEAGGATLCADISSPRGGLDRFPLRIHFAGIGPESLDPIGDPFVAALLWPSMRLAEPLTVEAGISPRLVESLDAIQAVSSDFVPNLTRIEVTAPIRDGQSVPASGRGLFFSCGVDSMYSLLKSRRTLTHLITVMGFDLIAGGEPMYERISASAAELARENGLQSLRVHTNLRELGDRFLNWGLEFYPMGPVMVGLAAQRLLGSCIISTDNDSRCITDYCANPVLSYLWSTESMQITCGGLDASRLERVRRIAEWDLAMRHLRVCLNITCDNCGRCEKCIRTLLELAACGVPPSRWLTFPGLPRVSDVSGMHLASRFSGVHLKDLPPLLEGQPEYRAYGAALRRALRNWKIRYSCYRLREASARGPAARFLLPVFDFLARRGKRLL